MRIPRTLHRLYAWTAGYFWTPCPLCDVFFGGHEWRIRDGHSPTIPKGSGLPLPGGTAICPACTAAGAGCLRWRARGHELHPLRCSTMAAA